VAARAALFAAARAPPSFLLSWLPSLHASSDIIDAMMPSSSIRYIFIAAFFLAFFDMHVYDAIARVVVCGVRAAAHAAASTFH